MPKEVYNLCVKPATFVKGRWVYYFNPNVSSIGRTTGPKIFRPLLGHQHSITSQCDLAAQDADKTHVTKVPR